VATTVVSSLAVLVSAEEEEEDQGLFHTAVPPIEIESLVEGINP
jgi:hypothetical protein